MNNIMDRSIKTALLSVAMFLSCVTLCFGQLTCKVDERMELTSIAFRIAEVDEFINDKIPEYSEAIDKWFGKYKSHELFALIKKMREEHGLAFAGVAASAPFLVIDENGVRDSGLKAGSEIDGRWTDDNWKEYVRLLDDFYRKSRFHKFFISQQELYDNIENSMDYYLEEIDTAWFNSFFGTFDKPVIYVAAANGPNNYGFDDPTIKPDGYGIAIGYTGQDPTNMILHEMCHGYTSFSDDYYPQVHEAMKRIFETPGLLDTFLKNRYSSTITVFNEWLTELAVAMYKKEHIEDETYLPYQVAIAAEHSGYIWMQRAVQFMDNFYANRDIYPYFKNFMPRICEFMNYTTAIDNWMKVIKENNQERPYIVNTYPVEGSNLHDYKNLETVRITFSEQMHKARGFKGGYPIEDFPFDVWNAYWEDGRTLVIPLFPDAELKDGNYYIVLNKDFNFSRQTGKGLKNDYTVNFYFKKQ